MAATSSSPTWAGLSSCLPLASRRGGLLFEERESMRETHLCLFLTSSVPEHCTAQHSTPPLVYSNSTLGPPPLQLPRPSCSPASGWPLHPPRSVSRSPPCRPAPLAPAIEFHSSPSVPYPYPYPCAAIPEDFFLLPSTSRSEALGGIQCAPLLLA